MPAYDAFIWVLSLSNSNSELLSILDGTSPGKACPTGRKKANQISRYAELGHIVCLPVQHIFRIVLSCSGPYVKIFIYPLPCALDHPVYPFSIVFRTQRFYSFCTGIHTADLKMKPELPITD